MITEGESKQSGVVLTQSEILGIHANGNVNRKFNQIFVSVRDMKTFLQYQSV